MYMHLSLSLSLYIYIYIYMYMYIHTIYWTPAEVDSYEIVQTKDFFKDRSCYRIAD